MVDREGIFAAVNQVQNREGCESRLYICRNVRVHFAVDGAAMAGWLALSEVTHTSPLPKCSPKRPLSFSFALFLPLCHLLSAHEINGFHAMDRVDRMLRIGRPMLMKIRHHGCCLPQLMTCIKCAFMLLHK